MVITQLDYNENSFVVRTEKEGYVARMVDEDLIIGHEMMLTGTWKVWLNPMKLERSSFIELVDYIASWDRYFVDYSSQDT